ncbi:MAG: DUF4038 domain-containing protein [candidate division KSB1 bacterium]|nr:DUF4038 domain-containing protein [candidate division KSB1 bacterium]
MNSFLRYAALGVILTVSGQAQSPERLVGNSSNGDLPSAEVKVSRYEVFELTLETETSYRNPYLEVMLRATFQGPSAKLIVEGFWDGENTWKIRIAPTEVGRWSYTTLSNAPELNGRTGSFTCVPSTSHGFIRVNPNYPASFMYSDGTPFLWMGETSWSWPFSSVPFDGTFQQYVEARAAQKFNHIHGMIIGDDFEGNEGGVPFGSPEDDYSKDRINPGFFQWVDKRIEYLASRGIVPGIMLGWPDGKFLSRFTQKQLDRLCRYLIARYAAYNVVWELFGEFEEMLQFSGLDPVITTRHYGELFKQYDPYSHLVSTHTIDSNNELGAEWWLDYLMHQSVQFDLITEDRARFGKPVINAEFYYELGPEIGDRYPHQVGPDMVRRGAWEVLMAGGYLCFGNTGTYIDCNLNYVNTPGATYMSYLYQFFQKTSFWKLTPNHLLVNQGRCLAVPGEEYVIYLPKGGTVSVDLSHLVSGFLAVEWYNPRTGESATMDSVTIRGSSQTFAAPDTNDWVLYLLKRTLSTPLKNELPLYFELNQNYPNPFRGETKIVYQLFQQSQVKLVLYDLLGQKLRVFVDEEQEAGIHEVHWDGRDQSGQTVAAGIYLYFIQVGHFRGLRKLIIIK